MQGSNEVVRLGTKIIAFIGDGMMYAWRLFIDQVSLLLNTRWDTQSAFKIVLVVLVVALIVWAVGRFIAIIIDVLAAIGAYATYALALLFGVGLMAGMVNWLMQVIPNTVLAFK